MRSFFYWKKSLQVRTRLINTIENNLTVTYPAYPEFFLGTQTGTHQTHKSATMVGARQINFQICASHSPALPVLDFFLKHFPNYFEKLFFVDDF